MIALINRKRLISSITYNPKKIYTWQQFEWEVIGEISKVWTVRFYNTRSKFTWDVAFPAIDSNPQLHKKMITVLRHMVRLYSDHPKYQ